MRKLNSLILNSLILNNLSISSLCRNEGKHEGTGHYWMCRRCRDGQVKGCADFESKIPLEEGRKVMDYFVCKTCTGVVRGPSFCNVCGSNALVEAKCQGCGVVVQPNELYCGSCGMSFATKLYREILHTQAGRRTVATK